MKVLLINNFHFRKGGSETVYFNTAKMLRDHGHEVMFFSCESPKNEPAGEQNFFAKGFGGTASPKDIIKYYYNGDAARKLEKLLEVFHPDVADIHLFWGNLSVSILSVLRRAGVPIVHTVHDYRMICPAYTFRDGKGSICKKTDCKVGCILKKCCKASFFKSIMMQTEFNLRKKTFPYQKYFDALIYVSHFSKQLHQNCNPSLEKIYSKVIYNCTEDQEKEFSRENGGKYFLFYGRLSKEKGVHTLINAYTDERVIPLHIVGTGPQDEQLRVLAATKKNISFLGYMSGESLRREIAGARAVIVPSEWYENNPLTIIESYSMHVPVIGAKIGGIPEIVPDGKTGFLFDSGSVEELQKVISKCEQLEESAYDSLCKNAYEFFRQNFSKQSNYEGLMEVFNHVTKL